MYISVWCLLLAFPRLDINLDLSTACLLYSNLRVVLVDTLSPNLNLLFLCVFEALRRKPAHRVSSINSYLFVLGVHGT